MSAYSDDQVRSLASEILSRSPYAQWRRHGSVEWIHSFLDSLSRFFAWLNNLADTRPVLYVGLMLTLLAVSIALTLHLVYTVRLAMRVSVDDGSAKGSAPAPRLADDAARFASAGRFLEAAHHMQLAVIELLLQRGIVELARCEPNRILRERLRLAQLPAHEREHLMQLIDQLERQWFRDRRADRSLYEAWRLLHARLSLAVAP